MGETSVVVREGEEEKVPHRFSTTEKGEADTVSAAGVRAAVAISTLGGPEAPPPTLDIP